jgi:hypothetical protein
MLFGLLMFVVGGAAILLMWRYGMIEHFVEADDRPRSSHWGLRRRSLWRDRWSIIFVGSIMVCAAGLLQLVTGRSIFQLASAWHRLNQWQKCLLFYAVILGGIASAFFICFALY